MDGKLVSSDMSVTWGTIKYGCIPVPGLFHMIMEVWESPMHVAVIRCSQSETIDVACVGQLLRERHSASPYFHISF